MMQNAPKKVQFYQRNGYNDPVKAAKRVLFELCEELDGQDEAEGNEYEDAETFFGDIKDNLHEYSESSENEDEDTEDVSEQLFTRTVNNQYGNSSLTDCLEDF